MVRGGEEHGCIERIRWGLVVGNENKLGVHCVRRWKEK
jgi:hypothetical protein